MNQKIQSWEELSFDSSFTAIKVLTVELKTIKDIILKNKQHFLNNNRFEYKEVLLSLSVTLFFTKEIIVNLFQKKELNESFELLSNIVKLNLSKIKLYLHEQGFSQENIYNS